MFNNYDHLIKMMLVGESWVGKSCLLLRYADDYYTESYIHSLGVDFKIQNVTIDGERNKLQICDPTNRSRYQPMPDLRGVSVILVCFDLTDQTSFENLNHYLQGIARYTKDDFIKILVGNKSDNERGRRVSRKSAEDFAEKFAMPYFETSAKQNINVHEVFETATRLFLQKKGVFLKSAPQKNSVEQELKKLKTKMEQSYPGLSFGLPEQLNFSKPFEIEINPGKNKKETVESSLRTSKEYVNINSICTLKTRNSIIFWTSIFHLQVGPLLQLENQFSDNKNSNNNNNQPEKSIAINEVRNLNNSFSYEPKAINPQNNQQCRNNNNNNNNQNNDSGRRLTPSYQQISQISGENNRSVNQSFVSDEDKDLKRAIQESLAINNSNLIIAPSHPVQHKEPIIKNTINSISSFLKNTINPIGFFEKPSPEKLPAFKAELEIPNALLCGITLEIMNNPVVIETGQTYEEEAIKKWFEEHNTCPNTRVRVQNKIYFNNQTVKKQVLEFKEKNPDYFPKESSVQPNHSFSSHK